jgi:hypothetical protein
LSPRAGDRRRITGRQIGAAAAGAAMIAIAIGVLSTIGGRTDIPTPPTTITRIDLLATRDLDTSTPCGLPAGGVSDKQPSIADQTWTRTGGSSCYPISATAAQCFTSAEVPYTVDATGLGWVVEPDATNRVAYSTAIDCTNWTCAGGATVDATRVAAPDGTLTASAWSAPSGGTAYCVAGGYANDAPLDLRAWVKCSAGTLRMSNPYGAGLGDWRVNCAAISAGSWVLINRNTPGLTKTAAWAATAAGAACTGFNALGTAVSAHVWAPTLTEEPGTGLAVIPTAASAVSTGDQSWAISNGLRNTGAQLVADGDMEAVGVGDWTAVNNAALTKDATNFHGGAQSLKVAYIDTNYPKAQQAILTIGKMYQAIGWMRGDGGTGIPKVTIGSGVGRTEVGGTNSVLWQAFDITGVAVDANLWLIDNALGASWVEFDDVTVYEQESYGKYYRPGDTVTQLLDTISGTCWVPLTATGDLLLTGAPGSECAGLWRALQVTR